MTASFQEFHAWQKQRAKNHASFTAMGKPLPLTEYSTFARQRESPALGVEQATFDLWQNSREFYHNACGFPIGPTYRLLKKLVSDGDIWCVVEEK